jgi:hypothetical protein
MEKRLCWTLIGFVSQWGQGREQGSVSRLARAAWPVRAPDPENYILAPEKNIFAVLNPEKNILYQKTRLWIVSSLSSSLDQSLTEK